MSSSLPKQSLFTDLPADLPANAAAAIYILLSNPPLIKQWREAFFLLFKDIEFN